MTCFVGLVGRNDGSNPRLETTLLATFRFPIPYSSYVTHMRHVRWTFSSFFLHAPAVPIKSKNAGIARKSSNNVNIELYLYIVMS